MPGQKVCGRMLDIVYEIVVGIRRDPSLLQIIHFPTLDRAYAKINPDSHGFASFHLILLCLVNAEHDTATVSMTSGRIIKVSGTRDFVVIIRSLLILN